MKPLLKDTPLKGHPEIRHLTNQDTCFGPNGVHIREVPMYNYMSYSVEYVGLRWGERVCMSY